MRIDKVKESINDFINLQQVKEILETTNIEKNKINLEIEHEVSNDSNTYCIFSINVERKQGFSGFRKRYLL